MVAGAETIAYIMAKSGVFGVRNVDKGQNGQTVRYAVAAGQFKNLLNAFSETKWMGSSVAKNAVTAIDTAAKTTGKLSSYLAKGVNFASSAVNPLICVSGAYQVAKAEDKDSEATKQICALGTMFTGEHLAKKLLVGGHGNEVLKSLGIAENGIVKNLLKTAAKHPTGSGIAKGCMFVVTSIASFALGAKIADSINNAVNDKKPAAVC